MVCLENYNLHLSNRNVNVNEKICNDDDDDDDDGFLSNSALTVSLSEKLAHNAR